MRKFMVVAIPIVTLALFILIMQGGFILKGPLGNEKGIPESIDEIISDIQDGRWNKAGEKSEDLDALWERIVARIQFSAERNEINSFSKSIARLRGAILAEDKTNALMELKEAAEHWSDLAR